MLIKGKITDYEGYPIPNAHVIIKGTNPVIGVVTDFDGKYAINANKGDILKFSYVGTNQTIERNVTYVNVIDITMATEIQLPGTTLIGKKPKKFTWLPLIIVGGVIAINQARKEKAQPKKITI